MLSPILQTCLAIALAFPPGVGADAPAPEINLPKEIKGEASDWIKVVAETNGKLVRWVSLTPGLRIFPAEFLKNDHGTVVMAAKPGRYRLLCYTALGDIPSDPAIVTIIVEGDAPPIPPSPPNPVPPVPPTPPVPPPVPPTPPPDPVDALTRRVRDALAADPGSATDKATYAAALSGFYAAMSKHVATDQVATVGDLLSDYRAAIPAVLPEGAILGTRKTCGQEVAAVCGDDAERKIDGVLKAKLVDLFSKLSKALEVK